MNRMMIVGASVVSALALAACGGETEPPKAPEAPPPAAPAPAPVAQAEPAASEDDGSQSQINISADIRQACGITDAEALFAYDSANVRQGDAPTLDKLAQCFVSGKLAGRAMRLVGHADPRGDEEYNMVLGGRRAESVKSYLVGAGLQGEQAQTTSRGEMDASGTDEGSWMRDRRVDVVLAN